MHAFVCNVLWEGRGDGVEEEEKSGEQKEEVCVCAEGDTAAAAFL